VSANLPDRTIQELRAFADALADSARTAILPHFRAAIPIEDKGVSAFDPVTQADRDSESAMRALIEQRFPEHGILGEEFGEKPARGDFTWVLDPIDGTRAFIAGLPLWGVLIGLYHQGRPLLGVMDQPYLDERFRGWPGGAEFVARGQTRPLKTRACASLSHAVLATTDPYLFQGAEAEAFARVRGAAKLTRYGGDCYAYCMLAAGHVDVVIESGLNAYDIAALIPIIEGAGGSVTSWSGADASQGGQVLALGDARLAGETAAMLTQAARA
jgi:myo-inositol-1(or 4)-monophosphatase